MQRLAFLFAAILISSLALSAQQREQTQLPHQTPSKMRPVS